jgi:hypothetical protein
MRRRTLFALSALLALLLPGLAWAPAGSALAGPGTSAPYAAPPGPQNEGAKQASPAADLITFAQYRAFRLRLIAERQAVLAKRLETSGLAPLEKARLERIKGYYDWQAALPAARRDTLFRTRFEAIDTDRDGTIDLKERAAWRAKLRARYRALAAKRAAQRPAAQH